jgi:hypothetical protein
LEIKPLLKKQSKGASSVRTTSVFGDDDEGDESDEEPPTGPPLPPALLADHSKKRPRPSEAIRPLARIESSSTSWLQENILVRIVDERSAHFKQKAVVVDANRLAQVKLLSDGSLLSIKQKYLETVIPKTKGGLVCILQGPHRGQRPTVQELDKKTCQAALRLVDGSVLERVDYNDFSQLYEDSSF